MATPTITGISITPAGYSFTWTADGDIDVYLRGEIYTRGEDTSPFVVADNQEPGCPDVVILDTKSEPPLGCAYIALQWRFVPDVDGYTVYEIISETPVSVGWVPASSTDGYLSWKSGILTDGTQKTYSVSAKSGTAESTIHTLTATVIRNPRVPVCKATIITAEDTIFATFDVDPYAGVRR